ncbi:ribosomal_S10 domain-containing protein [Trichonephila clavata]|uniref:Ribosomal_S10 domain-containing protein n=1 Tax=Trichonephila clavata TaxID=2740835 RepID=A0A8X6KUQ9_TRICU|nr:ribosomal_S10 domain-containing protein [Trichonephila clavata]
MNSLLKISRYISLSRCLRPACRLLNISAITSKYVDEPDYIKFTKPQVPVYERLNIQMKAYDYTVLEHYAKHVHKIAHNMDFEVSDAWATPHQAWKVTNHEPNTTKVSSECVLNKYERNIQITNLPAYCASTFFEIIQSSLPMGVFVSIHPHEEQHSEIRYIPDFELIVLKKQLEELVNPDDAKK